MPYNGSGTFTLPAGNPVVTGTTISSVTNNATNTDLANGLSNAVTRNGQSPPTTNLPMGGFKLTGLAVGSGTGESVNYDQVVLKTGGTMTGVIVFAAAQTIGVANGGTNLTAVGASGNVLTSNGTTWTSSTPTPGLTTGKSIAMAMIFGF